MTAEEAETFAEHVRRLSNGLIAIETVLTERALVVLLAHSTGLSGATIKKVLRGVREMPQIYLAWSCETNRELVTIPAEPPVTRGIVLRD